MIKCPPRVKCNSSSIIDHVLASSLDRVSQSGVTDVGISDHQLIYCTRKIAIVKKYCHKQITFRSLKNYLCEIYEEALITLNFPNYKTFDVIDKAYENFTLKVMAVIDNLATSKKKRIKGISQGWKDKLFKIY